MIWEKIQSFVSPSNYIPHGHCYLWQTPLVGLHLISDLLTAIAYFSIPAMLVYFVYKRDDVPFSKVFVLFSAFILLCGTGHLLEIWTLWHPAYWLTGIEQALTGLVSCYTALQLVELLPQFLALRTPEQLEAVNQELEKQIIERKRAEQTLQTIVVGTASVTGEQFFPALVRHLAIALNIDHVLVSEFNNQSQKFQILAQWSLNQFIIPYEYDPADSPCAWIMNHAQPYLCATRVCEQFSNSDILKELKAESYLGMPLLDTKSQVIGVLCLTHSQPLSFDENFRALIHVFAARASAELQRKQAENNIKKAFDQLEIRVQERTADLEKEIKERIAAQSALQAQERFLDRTINAIADPIFVKDRQNSWTIINDAFCQMLGRSREELLGKTASDFFSVDVAESMHKQDEWVFTTENEHEQEEELINAVGNKYIVLTKKVISTDALGNPVLVGVMRDITKRKQMERALQQAKESADRANCAKSEFLANMSHELRTPLNAILGFTQLMNRDRSLSQTHRHYIEIINRSGEHLLELINDILEMTKIETGRNTPKTKVFSLQELLSNLDKMLRLKAEAKGLTLVIEQMNSLPPFIETDESKLRQIIINLLGNAIKFTDQGTVTLRMGSRQDPALDSRDISYLYIEVEDTGFGIAPEEINQVFEPFTQTEAGLKTAQGTGLGLTISQKFVHLLGGELKVNSQLGKGTRFSFKVPVKVIQKNSYQQSQINPKIIGLAPNQLDYRILVVEDKPFNRLLLVELLASIGFNVREAENGQDAIAIWESWEPQLIWMDMRMPIMNGYEATQKIRSTLKGQATAIIAITASAFTEQTQEILNAGCDDCICKPFATEEILELMAKHLGVQYLYETPDYQPLTPEISPLTSVELSPKLETVTLKSMPMNWIEDLYKQAAKGNDNALNQLINEIPEHQKTLIKALQQLIEQYQFEKIMELADQAKGMNCQR